MLSRQEILGATDLRTETVSVPEWGGDVRIRELSMLKVDMVNKAAPNDNTRKMAAAIAFSIVDEDGKQVFSDADIDQVLDHSSAALKKLSDAVAKLNGWAGASAGDAEKNSASAPAGASSSN